MRDDGADADRPRREPPPDRDPAGARFGARGRELARQPPRPPPAPPATDDILEWEPAAGAGPLVGRTLLALLLLIVLLALWQFRAAGGVAKGVWLLVGVGAAAGAGYAGYLLRGLGTLRYVFTPQALLVRWMREEQAIPYADMLDVVYRPRDALRLAARERFWPGYYVSVVRRPEGVWRSWATEPPARRVRIVTPLGVTAISPRRAIRFLDELDRRQAAALASAQSSRFTAARTVAVPAQPAGQPSSPGAGVPAAAAGASRTPLGGLDRATPRDIYQTLFRERLLGDPVASALVAVGVALPLVMAAYLFSQYEGAPRDVPLHWNAHGQLDRVGQRRDLWLLPLMAAVILLVNTLLATFASAYDRFAARLLTAGTPIAQIATLIALLRLMH